MDADGGSRREDVLATLRRVRPAHVRVLTDEGNRDIALRKGRGRWEHAVHVLWPMLEDGATAELLDSEKRLAETVRLDEDNEDGKKGPAPRERDWLSLMLEAQRVALDHQHKMMSDVMDAFRGLAQTLSDRVAALERTYAQTLKEQHRSIIQGAEAEAELIRSEAESQQNDMVQGVVQGLMQALGKDVPVPPNGQS